MQFAKSWKAFVRGSRPKPNPPPPSLTGFRADIARSRAAYSRTGAGFHFGLGLPNRGFKFRGKFHLVFDKIVKPIADLP